MVSTPTAVLVAAFNDETAALIPTVVDQLSRSPTLTHRQTLPSLTHHQSLDSHHHQHNHREIMYHSTRARDRYGLQPAQQLLLPSGTTMYERDREKEDVRFMKSHFRDAVDEIARLKEENRRLRQKVDELTVQNDGLKRRIGDYDRELDFGRSRGEERTRVFTWDHL